MTHAVGDVVWQEKRQRSPEAPIMCVLLQGGPGV